MTVLVKTRAIHYELLTDESEIIGGVFAVNHRQYIEIVDLFVNKEFQNQGHGRALMQTIFDNYPNKILCLQCGAFSNGLSQGNLAEWYKRLGFVEGTPFHQGDGWMHKPI
jgi:GNAT superfamily N-acetyltransferase